MSVSSPSTLLLRGGHRWDCADAQAVLAHLASPSPDQHRVFNLRGADGQTLTVPAREIVGVLANDQGASEDAAAAPIPQIAAMRKKSGLPGSPYLLVDEFLSASEFAWVMAYALSQEPGFIDAKVTDSANDYRKAKVLYDLKPIVDLFIPRVRAMAPQALRMLDLQPVNIKTIECQLTAHGDGDYFKRHNDNGSKETAQRYLTYVYYFNRAPAGFSGGMLRMYETVVENGFYTMGKTFEDINPRSNCLVMFPSYCPHEVTPVTCPSGQFADWRFTVNGWVVREA